MAEIIDRYVAAALTNERNKRAAFKAKLFQAIEELFRFDLPIDAAGKQATYPLAVSRGRTYRLLATAMNEINNNPFKKAVRVALRELGIKAVCVHRRYLFRGMFDEIALEAWLKQRAKVAAELPGLRVRQKAGFEAYLTRTRANRSSNGADT